MSTDAVTGERLFCVVAGSVERPEVPNMEKLCKRIRSTVQTSGERRGWAGRVYPVRACVRSVAVNVKVFESARLYRAGREDERARQVQCVISLSPTQRKRVVVIGVVGIDMYTNY